MRSIAVVLGGIVLFAAAPAWAAIRINDARYENGVLTVSGQAKPNQTVTLGDKFHVKSDGGGHFEFHESFKPPTCMADIASGEDSYSAIVTGCLLGDAAAAIKE
jgi:hypothetical protein